MIKFDIKVDTKRWLRGNARDKKRIINARRKSAIAISKAIVNNAREILLSHNLMSTSGELLSSIQYRETKEGATVEVLANHAWFLEYGTGVENTLGIGRKTPWAFEHRTEGRVWTKGAKPKPFFEPAVLKTELMSRKILQGVWRNGLSTR